MKHLSSLFVAVSALLLATAPLVRAQGTYTQIDYPGGYGTSPVGMDSAGDVSGFYSDSPDEGKVHGFLLIGGTYTSIDYPGATWTELYGMNDMGQVVGGADLNAIGFLYDIQSQTFTQLACQCATITVPYAINNAGTIVGNVITSLDYEKGFELIGSTYNKILPHGDNTDYLLGITTSGEIVGWAQEYFSYNNGKYQHLAGPPIPQPHLTGIDPTGAILIGYYSPTETTLAGFAYQNGNVETLQFPGATMTYAASVNSSGVVVGRFNTALGYHGYMWTPPAAASKK